MSARDHQETLAKLQQILATSAGKAELSSTSPELNLTEAGILDSFEFLNFVSDLEASFGKEIDLSEEAPSRFLTLQGLAQILACTTPGGK